MCWETWPRTMLPSLQLKAHYGVGPWVLVRQSGCCWASTSSRRCCRPLCLPAEDKGHKVLSVSIGLSACHAGETLQDSRNPDPFFKMSENSITNIMTDDVSYIWLLICESAYTLITDDHYPAADVTFLMTFSPVIGSILGHIGKYNTADDHRYKWSLNVQ